jgi:ribosomal protein L11 methyltransferase
VVTPSWATPTPGQAELTVELDPGMAFGTGLHPTTRMCLELLEEAFDRARPRGVPPSAGRGGRRRHSGGAPSVLDLGTGSGLLAIAAFRYGAGSVLALDTDPVACRVASENAGRNGAAGGISIRHGSIERAGRRTFDVVLANLTTEALIGLAPRLVRALGSEGRLIASGMLSEQAAQVCAAFGRWGVRLERARRHGGWAAVMLRRAPVRRPVPGR